MNPIVMLLLTNGEEVFGELLSENDRGIDLDNALVAQYTNIKGIPTVIFRKYCSYSKNFDIFFKREHIIAVFKDLQDEIIKSYHTTMEAYKSLDVSTLIETDDILNFDPDFGIDNELDSLDELDIDDSFDDSYYYQNKKRKVH